jgi:hypothetical protein
MRYPIAKLQNVADVQLGITLRGADAARHVQGGSHQLLRIGDLSEDGDLRITSQNLILLNQVNADHFGLRGGDVLLAARGTRMTAAVFKGGFTAVAGSQFCVIRVKQAILPAYLHWFLNLPETQEKLASGARGTYVKSLPASILRELTIPVLPLPKQKMIAELHELRLSEKRLVAKLVDLRARVVDQSALNFINC